MEPKSIGQRPGAVVKKYAGLYGGPVNVREIIALSLREGSLHARAAHRWISTEKTLSSAWANEPDKENHPKPKEYLKTHDIKKVDWSKSISVHDDILLWDFRRSRLHITISSSPVKRIMLRDVRLKSADVKEIFSLKEGETISNFQRAVKINSWRRFWHEIVILSLQSATPKDDKLLSNFKNDTLILDTIIERINLEDCLNSEYNESDQNIASIINQRLEFDLRKDSILQEIKKLRQALGLKRAYASAGKKTGVSQVFKIGSAGRTT